MNHLRQDLRYAWRSLVKMPGLASVIILSIALGIAANTTIFSIANGLLWGLLPVHDPGRLVMFSEGRSFSYPDYLDYREQTGAIFENGVAAHFPIIPVSVGGSGAPQRIWGQAVSGNYFAVLEPRMALGRPILPQEDTAVGRDAVAVLSHSLWTRRFGGDPKILNHSVTLNGKPYTVVGIASPGFEGADRGIVSDFWVPLAMAEVIMPDLAEHGLKRNDRGYHWLMLDARLKPGVSRSNALAAVNLVSQRLDLKYRPGQKRSEPVTLQTAGALIAGSATPAHLLIAVLTVIVGALLLVVCANVGNLLLARAAGRQREIAIRISLGASRRRLIAQLLTESMLLALAGAALGFLLAAVAAHALSSFQLPVPLPIKLDFNVDLRVLLFTLFLTPATALLFGVVPALRATHPDIAAVLKSESGSSPRVKRLGMRSTLVVLQITISVFLLAAAGLFLRSLRNAASIDIGFDPDNILISAVDPRIHGYSNERTAVFLSQLRQRVSAIPGVSSVGFVDLVPLSIAETSYEFTADASGSQPARRVSANVFNVSDGFFRTMGIPLHRGRDFRPQPELNAVILNERMAAQLFPNQDPIGKTVRAEKTNYTVVGVAQNSKARSIGEDPTNCSYLRLGGAPSESAGFFGISMLVKTASDPRRFEQPVRSAIATLDPNMAVFNVETMQDHVSKSLFLPKVSSLLLTIFSIIGLTLAAIGLYAVMSYTVRRREHEIGIRMAVGARPSLVLKMVLRQSLMVACIGLAIGTGIVLLLGRFTASLLYGVRGTDLITCAAVSAVLLVTAIVATILPAIRAARVDPSTALRHE